MQQRNFMTKLEQIKTAYQAGNFEQAIRIAAKFPDLGAQRNAILDAHLAITNPRWMLGLGKDIEQSIDAGIQALALRYKFWVRQVDLYIAAGLGGFFSIAFYKY